MAVVSGLLLYLALPPNDVWWCAWFALVPLLVALRGKSIKQAAWLGWLCGATVNFGAFHWLKALMVEYTTLGPLVYLVMLAMAFYQGVPYLLWAALLRGSLAEDGGKFQRTLALAACAMSLPTLEFFYPIVFPWYLANTQHSQPNLTGIIELGGCGLLSLAIVVVNLCLARLLLAGEAQSGRVRVWPFPFQAWAKKQLALVLMATFWLCWGFSVIRNNQIASLEDGAETVEVGLVQPNHWIHGVTDMEALHDYQKLSLELVEEAARDERPLDLLVWPESAVRTPPPRHLSSRGPSDDEDRLGLPLDLLSIEQGQSRPAPRLSEEQGVDRWELLSIQRGHQVPLLFGCALTDHSPDAEGPMPGRDPTYNCGILLDKKGEVLGIAPKVELLLFGETIPGASYFPQVYKVMPLASALLPGEGPKIITFNHARLGLMICYEDLLSDFHYRLAQGKPQLLFNLTNDAWFGKTDEAEAHLALSKLRCVEGRVSLVRSTTTGVSAVVDATGRVKGSIGQDVRGTLRRSVALLDVETGFERWGDSVVWMGLLVLVFHLLISLKRGGR